MKRITLFAIFAFALILGSCARQMKSITEKDVEELRVDYNKGKMTAMEDIIAVYKDPSLPIETRIAAMKSLATTQNPDAIKILHDFLNQCVGVNYALLTATSKELIKGQRPEDVSAMVRGVISAQKKYIQFRTEVLQNLSQMNISFQVEELLNLYASEKENYVLMQESLTRAMGSVEDYQIIPILINIAKDNSIKISVRSLALEMLAKKRHPDISKTFIEMLGDPESQLQVRDFALKAMADIKQAQVIRALLDTYESGRQEYMGLLEVLTNALGDYSDPVIQPALIEIAMNKEYTLTVRRNALNALVKFKDPETFESLLPMMEDPDNYILFDEIASLASAIGGIEPFDKLREKSYKAIKSNMVTQ